mgnify:FL=1
MNKYVIGIFAHPDDAAFGPSGTLHMAAQSGSEVHLICATCGDAGMNVDQVENLADVREAEEKRASELIGVTSLELFRLSDGELCNNKYIEIADRVVAHIESLLEGANEVTLITFDTNGLSGHVDHIVMSLAATYAYLKLRESHPDVTFQLKYFCLSDQVMKTANTNWIYGPKGRSSTEIDETIDVSSVRERKLEIMHAHHTQRSDARAIISLSGDKLFEENFYYYKD